jgi:hypothetical protein
LDEGPFSKKMEFAALLYRSTTLVVEYRSAFIFSTKKLDAGLLYISYRSTTLLLVVEYRSAFFLPKNQMLLSWILFLSLLVRKKVFF